MIILVDIDEQDISTSTQTRASTKSQSLETSARHWLFLSLSSLRFLVHVKLGNGRTERGIWSAHHHLVYGSWLGQREQEA